MKTHVLLNENGFTYEDKFEVVESNTHVIHIDLSKVAPNIRRDFERTGILFLSYNGEAMAMDFSYFNFGILFEDWSDFDKEQLVWFMDMLKKGYYYDIERFEA